jgi:hypothetical protein
MPRSTFRRRLVRRLVRSLVASVVSALAVLSGLTVAPAGAWTATGDFWNGYYVEYTFSANEVRVLTDRTLAGEVCRDQLVPAAWNDYAIVLEEMVCTNFVFNCSTLADPYRQPVRVKFSPSRSECVLI